MVQPISKTFKDAAMLKRLKLAAGVPVSLQVLGWLEELSATDLAELSGMATFPLVPLMTVAHALRTNLEALMPAKQVDRRAAAAADGPQAVRRPARLRQDPGRAAPPAAGGALPGRTARQADAG